MKYHELQTIAVKKGNRVGRGIAAGQGKTAGRGTKGQKARTGSSARPGFAGGQNPLMQQLPKLPGFKSHKLKAENVYTGQLDQFSGKTVDAHLLAEAKIISNPYVRIKLIHKGEITKKVNVELNAASENAILALEKVGGSFKKVARLSRPASTKKSDKE